MQEAARREALAQAPDEPVGEPPFHRADRLGVPFVQLEVVDRDEGGLAAHGEAHVVGDEDPVDLLPQSVERRPGLFRERLGDARMLGDPLDPHVEREFDLGEARQPRDRHSVAVVGGGGERNVAFAGEEARGRIEPDPPGAWKIDLRPGMKIGEVVVGSRRPVQRDEIGFQLDQIAGDEARGQAQMAENLHQEPARIAARARPALEGLLGALHPRLHPDDVFDLLRNAAIEIDREIDRALRRAVDPVEKRLQARPCRFRRAVDDEVGPEILAIFERPGLRALLDKEIERIVDRHVGDDVDLDPQLADEFGEDVAGEPVAVRILLMVHEMLGRRHFERM